MKLNETKDAKNKQAASEGPLSEAFRRAVINKEKQDKDSSNKDVNPDPAPKVKPASEKDDKSEDVKQDEDKGEDAFDEFIKGVTSGKPDEDDSEDGEDGEDEDDNEDGVSKKQDDDEEDENTETLVTKDGKPVSEAASKAFKSLKEKLDAANKSIDSLKKENELLKLNAGDTTGDDVKKQIATVKYLKSEEFKSKFVKPIEEITSKIERTAVALPKEVHGELGARLKSISAIAGIEEKEAEYFEEIDSIVEEFFDGRSALGNRMSGHLAGLWDAGLAYEKEKERAEKESDEILSKFGSGELNEDRVSKLSEGISKDLGKALEKKIQFWDSQEGIFGKSDSSEAKKAIAELGSFISTGKASPALISILARGVFHERTLKTEELSRRVIEKLSADNKDLLARLNLRRKKTQSGSSSKTTQKQSSKNPLLDAYSSASS